LAGYAMAIGFEARAFLGSASAADPGVLLALLGILAAELGRRGLAVRALVAASDRAVVDGLLGFGFRVFRACHYMVRGGGTAPPLPSVPRNGDMMWRARMPRAGTRSIRRGRPSPPARRARGRWRAPSQPSGALSRSSPGSRRRGPCAPGPRDRRRSSV